MRSLGVEAQLSKAVAVAWGQAADEGHPLPGNGHCNSSFYFGDLKQAQVLRSMHPFEEEVVPAFS